MASPQDHDVALRASMRDVAAHLVNQDAIGDTLGSVTAAAVDLIDCIDYADVLMITDGDFRSVKPTTPMIVELDQLQYDVGEGPRLAAASSDSIVRCPDFSADER
jgi:hypothetical protein